MAGVLADAVWPRQKSWVNECHGGIHIRQKKDENVWNSRLKELMFEKTLLCIISVFDSTESPKMAEYRPWSILSKKIEKLGKNCQHQPYQNSQS